ncbi:MAG TPA: NAD-dependent epimerase/dehydratase family protein [Mycobacteriales bacterium]|nr:NAD-dependent epimerase/dehydratase family protein [Mycobacteriales bacterium]
MSPVVLVTGVSRYLGARLAIEFAAADSVSRVIGVDTVAPDPELTERLGRVEFVRADIRNPLIAKVIATAEVDTVVHLSIAATPAVTGGGRSVMKEMNVIGTMQLLAACQKSDCVQRLVVKSTTAVYGSSSRDPAAFTEETEPPSQPRSGYAKDSAEIESYLRGFGRRRPDIGLCVLRLASVLGPTITSPLSRYLALPVVPTVLGFDPRIQLLHEDDAIAVLERAALGDYTGVVNVAGAGVLTLSQAIRRAGRVSLPVPGPAVGVVGRLLRQVGRIEVFPEQTRLLNLGRIVDTSRLRTEFGYQPRYDTAGTLADYLRGQDVRPIMDPGVVAGFEQRLRSVFTGPVDD